MQANNSQLYARCGYSYATKPSAYGKTLFDFKPAHKEEYGLKASTPSHDTVDIKKPVARASSQASKYPFNESCKGAASLTNQDIQQLKSKYDLNAMTPESADFKALLSDLHSKNAISDKDFMTLTQGIPSEFDSDGQPTKFNPLEGAKTDGTNILERLYSLNQTAVAKFNDIYKSAREAEKSPVGAELFSAAADSSKNTLKLLEQIFSDGESGALRQKEPQWEQTGNSLKRYMGKAKNATTIVRDANGNYGSSGHVIPLAGKDMLHCSFPGANGSSVFVNYAENSTDENPILLIQSTDENGNMYEELICPEDIDPANATYPQMLALNAHLKKTGELPQDNHFAIPHTLDFPKSFDTPINYAEICQNAIDKLRSSGYASGKEANLLDAYLSFFNKNNDRVNESPLYEILKNQAQKSEKSKLQKANISYYI